MSGKDSDDKRRSDLLSRALRAVRGIRTARSQDLADALGLSLRGYQHFEAGGGLLNFKHVSRFSRAMDCDPIGVLTAVQIGHPEFAAYVAQNKAMIAYMIALQEFVEDAGEAIAKLETSTFVSAYRAMFKDLAEKARASQAESQAWLAENAARLGLASEPDPTTGQVPQNPSEDQLPSADAPPASFDSDDDS